MIGRNDPCPCGSGKKYKKCHGARPGAAPKGATRSVGAPNRKGLITVRLPARSNADRERASARRVARFTAPGAKRLVLAYPHYSSVTTPPLGIAYLKGHIERTLPEWSVKNTDLNLYAHQELFRAIERAEGHFLPASLFPEGPEGERALLRAAETFRGMHPEEFYDRTDLMVSYSLLWNRAVRGMLYSTARLRDAFRGQAPMPAMVKRQAERLLAERPTAVGISVCYLEQFWASLCVAKLVRQRMPDVPILLGGTMFKEGIEENWQAERWPVDYIVTGAGELPLVEILAGRAESGNVPGVTLVDETGLRSTAACYENDFDALGDPDFSDFDPRAYYTPRPIFPVQTSRGCYWKRCTFCNHYRTVGGSYQLRSMDRLIAELRRHVEAGVRHFTFIDDIIAPSRFNHMSKAILEAGLDIRYYAMTRPMKQFSREVLQNMYAAGCRFILWGVESGSQRVLDLMEKGTKVDEVEKCLELAASVGIKNHVFVICGFPTETREEFQQTVAFLARAKPHIHCVHKTIYALERGTPIFDDPERFSVTRIWPKKTALLYDFECSKGMTRAEARKALDDARPFFRSFSAGKELEAGDFRFRDHLLLLYCRDDDWPSAAALSASA